jgi:hypothetical protein
MLLERMARHILILALLGAAITLAPVSNARSRYKPRKSDGTYTLNVAGYYTGQGNAQVTTGAGVHLTLSMTPESGGKSGSVDVTLPLTGNRFSGESTLFGKPVHFDGRLDVPDDDRERTLRGVRLVCRLKTTDPKDSKYASVIGYVPELSTARDAIDEGADNNKGKGNN